MIVGPTGTGKSTMLALIAAQFLRYRNAQIVMFDKGRSARAITHAVGGQYCELGDPDSMSLQPLAAIDRLVEMAFAQEWMLDIARREDVDLSPKTKDELWSALRALADFPIEQRTLTLLVSLVQDQDLRKAFQPFTLEGPYGAMLDASNTQSRDDRWQCFEMEALTDLPGAVAPTLLVIFHRLEQMFNGDPTLLILDEAWLFLDDSLFAARIKAWLKTLQKKNVSVLFATQSLADIEQIDAANDRNADTIIAGVPLDQLNFDYTIEGDQPRGGGVPRWRPVRAFDDGGKVYIEFPRNLGNSEVPPLFVTDEGGEGQLVNYRAKERYYVVDRLFDLAELRFDDTVVRISREDAGGFSWKRWLTTPQARQPPTRSRRSW